MYILLNYVIMMRLQDAGRVVWLSSTTLKPLNWATYGKSLGTGNWVVLIIGPLYPGYDRFAGITVILNVALILKPHIMWP